MDAQNGKTFVTTRRYTGRLRLGMVGQMMAGQNKERSTHAGRNIFNARSANATLRRSALSGR